MGDAALPALALLVEKCHVCNIKVMASCVLSARGDHVERLLKLGAYRLTVGVDLALIY